MIRKLRKDAWDGEPYTRKFTVKGVIHIGNQSGRKMIRQPLMLGAVPKKAAD